MGVRIFLDVESCRDCPFETNSSREHDDPFTSAPLHTRHWCQHSCGPGTLEDTSHVDPRCPFRQTTPEPVQGAQAPAPQAASPMVVRHFEVGYEGEMIGIYHGRTEEEAIKACRADMHGTLREHKFSPATPINERLKGLIANRID